MIPFSLPLSLSYLPPNSDAPLRRATVIPRLKARVFSRRKVYNPIDIQRRSTEWNSQGWTGFDAQAAPYTQDQIERDAQAYRDFAATSERERRTRVYEDATG